MFLNHLLYALLCESLDDGRYNASQTFPSNQKFMAVDRALCGITMLHVIGTNKTKQEHCFFCPGASVPA